MSFPVTETPFVQILHTGYYHWITIHATSPSLVEIYDSLYDSVTNITKMQIAALVCSPEDSIALRIHHTQFQEGASDCGIFAVAYATELAHGMNPASRKYDQKSLRGHFIQCLANGILTPFPSKEICVGKPKADSIELFCTCRMLYNSKEEHVQCSICLNKYHYVCAKVPDSVDTSHTWKCSECSVI